MADNTINGKAFEFVCLRAVQEQLQEEKKAVELNSSAAYQTASKAFLKLSDDEKSRYWAAAQTAVKLLFPLEPRISNGNGTIVLSIAADAIAQGPDGDVRDVLMIRVTDKWEIGISCKHNHAALKHPRITEKKDFGTDWVGIPCSQEFINDMDKVINPLKNLGESNVKWRDVADKQDLYYVPILQAYVNEIIRLCKNHEEVPEKLLSYFFGSHDFYKVIMKESSQTTTIEGFNMHGTLNQPAGKIKAMTRVAKINMPTRLIEAGLKPKSKTTIILIFDHGWSIAMRLHNKDEIAKPTSLAWDVSLIGMPPETYKNTHSWFEYDFNNTAKLHVAEDK